MTENELERWTTLVVAEARGQSLSPAARAERRQIEREQPELLGEASLWAEFAELEQPRPGERDDAAMIADVLARAQRSADEEPKPDRSRRVLGPALGLLALAACVALSLALGQLRERGRQAIDRGGEQPLGGAAMALDEEPQLLVATPGRHHLREDDCRRAGASARLCTRKQARFRVASKSTEEHVELELDDGQLHIDAADGTLVDVLTAAGLVRARGVVELSFDASTGALTIDVLDGEAELLGSEPTPVRLGVGATLSLIADTRPTIGPLPPEPEVVPEPELEVVPEPEPAAAPSAPSKPTADELLAAAQRALADGDSGEAIDRYDQLIRTHPQSHAARTASISLGRLLLRADRAADALATFDLYLDSGATELLEEARYGQIRALRELGREAELAAAIAEFLREHPGSIHRERLESWQTP